MTRSVEIPEAAVEAAAAAMRPAVFAPEADGLPLKASREGTRRDARVALAAALPYLEPAGDGGRTLCANCTACLDDCPDCAPAVPQPVDREALRERIREAIAAYLPSQWVEYDEEGGSIAAVAADAVLAVLAGEQEPD